jgi:hypothetical protein|eukprot:CAMPEP_0174309600 /NCGR_PEP_ID=MMETSP0810-20121108/2517_1 /TAXON_ID=73025 ORGANISM="Eutreptiella gymnastica-like, Strain CCMP1594" /NCGR_SAMPLE_ID=MMETSP0810 /ASSEMBLY_ACC=CAM_ASM_000659 /LENGTH=674 /DNA_ID=CAMNT_0015417285 /DNA_START=95 /DNA_END=2119 /DNA_ORIENTATION=-
MKEKLRQHQPKVEFKNPLSKERLENAKGRIAHPPFRQHAAEKDHGFKKRESFHKSAENPDKSGWLERARGWSWERRYFQLHGHYLSHAKEEGAEASAALNLWDVVDLTLNNNELTMSLNTKGSESQGLLAKLGKSKGVCEYQIRAASAEEAQQWLQALRQSGLGANPERIPVPTTTKDLKGWKIQHIHLKGPDGSILHKVHSVPDSGANVRVALGENLLKNSQLEVTIAMLRGAEQATGSQSFTLADRQGVLQIPVSPASGEVTNVTLSWSSEASDSETRGVSSAASNAVATLKPYASYLAGAGLFALLVSPVLMLLLCAGIGGYFYYASGSGSASSTSCFITRLDVGGSSAGTATHTPQATSAASESDLSITVAEMGRLEELRAALEDLKKPDSGISPAVFEKHVNTDYRLVRYLRARATIPEMVEMIKESLTWRTEFGADDFPDTYHPPDWMVKYLWSPMFWETGDRLSHYPRDKKGHMTLFWRGGVVDWKTLHNAVHGDTNVLMKQIVWIFELVRRDLERLHEQTKGKVPSYVTVVYDLEGFVYSSQMPVSVTVAFAKEFFRILNVSYPETIYRIVIVRAPWLFNSLWSILKPLIPPELLEKISMSGGGKPSKVVQNITPQVPADQVPKFLGGELTGPGGDPECHYAVGPAGPFSKDKGKALLAQGLAASK